jgi:hypothetical protein
MHFSLLLSAESSLGFLQPVRHAHVAVHRRRGGEMLSVSSDHTLTE